MIEIAPGDPGSAAPYSTLLPVVALLLAHGNRYVPGREGFIVDPRGGAACELELPLDFELLAAEVTFPETVDARPERDGILDRGTWCLISGPGERASRIVMPKRVD
ncbi:hypothetical protein [Streptomyces katrae]|uniref:hypothetical protein n=1 Tax=Streptomyces katrae TaxID=68223 RepID=UPI000A9BA7D9|nr:hypothetical protein [Streptomyces katrae]